MQRPLPSLGQALWLALIFQLAVNTPGSSQTVQLTQNGQKKSITVSNATLKLVINYGGTFQISRLETQSRSVLQRDTGIYSSFRENNTTWSTLQLQKDPVVVVKGHTVTFSHIVYGPDNNKMDESWTITVDPHHVVCNIERTLPKALVADAVAFPAALFDNMTTWEGAYTDYGGLAWFYLFNRPNDTYGVHAQSADFWNSKTGDGLTMRSSANGQHSGFSFNRTLSRSLAVNISTAPDALRYRFDSATQRRRYVRDTNLVWAPVALPAGTSRQQLQLTGFNTNEKYGRGNLKGINQQQVSAVLNTIARIGVIDRQLFGGNSWHTPYGPICLHEQYIAQLGVGINDPHYLSGYRETLDHYRDHAIRNDGRVMARWAYSDEDAMPGQTTPQGFYEAQWGWLMDSNPDYVTNVAELYDQIGDSNWVKTHQLSCEKALDWILARDENRNGLVEMKTDSHTQKRGSDWIDIIWAAYENAFVNAKLYRALDLWSAIETQLGHHEKAAGYAAAAIKLKRQFNASIQEGGFWDPVKKCYVHWRDKDGSIHGNNMVIPVNFMAIAYGICDDIPRRNQILDDVEAQMQQEKLFFWPLCMTSYAPGEGNDWQFPFPNYENGDIFLSWGSVGVEAYAAYKPELALKYVKNVLAQYEKDGLAFQRYGRVKQDGLGDDILSGNGLAIVGLYRSIYGIQPLYNRLYLQPHLTPALAGTELNYHFRNEKLVIGLSPNAYSIRGPKFVLSAATDFGYAVQGDTLRYFHRNDASPTLTMTVAGKMQLTMRSCNDKEMHWTQYATGTSVNVNYTVHPLNNASTYTLTIDGKKQPFTRLAAGDIVFTCNSKAQKIILSAN